MSIKTFLVIMTTYGILDYLDEITNRVTDSFEKIIPRFELFIWPDIVSPSMKCFDWSRRQYLASCLIDQLINVISRHRENGFYTVGIGYIDGFEHGFNFVFGEADPVRKLAVVFTRRLDQRFYGLEIDRQLYVERISKEIVHELGHLMNLKHCDIRECVMSFSNNVSQVDVKTRFFCEKCIISLKKNLLINY
ncbi:MAG: archaemetzincin family Zn-dependent metalloprotease [Desulfurococcaceae archaeon]